MLNIEPQEVWRSPKNEREGERMHTSMIIMWSFYVCNICNVSVVVLEELGVLKCVEDGEIFK